MYFKAGTTNLRIGPIHIHRKKDDHSSNSLLNICELMIVMSKAQQDKSL